MVFLDRGRRGGLGGGGRGLEEGEGGEGPDRDLGERNWEIRVRKCVWRGWRKARELGFGEGGKLHSFSNVSPCSPLHKTARKGLRGLSIMEWQT